MKTFAIELPRIKAMASSHGLARARVDASVHAVPARDDDGAPSSTLSLTVEDARGLLLLRKAQSAKIDSRQARSQRQA